MREGEPSFKDEATKKSLDRKEPSLEKETPSEQEKTFDEWADSLSDDQKQIRNSIIEGAKNHKKVNLSLATEKLLTDQERDFWDKYINNTAFGENKPSEEETRRFEKLSIRLGLKEHPNSEVKDQKVGDKEQSKQGVYSEISKAKDRILTSVKYGKLKTKEYLGSLNQKELDELMDIDFKEELKNNPPIDRVFRPIKELAEIKKLPKEEKRVALDSYKENLSKQGEAMASCRTFIERQIEFNNDVPREKLVGLIERFGQAYGFTDGHKQMAEQLIDMYYEKRQRALEVRQKNSDNVELVNELTGMKFAKTEKFDVSVNAMAIEIGANKFNAGRIYQKSESPVAGFNYGGFACETDQENPVFYNVINKEGGGILYHRFLSFLPEDVNIRNTRKHELEHQKNRLFSLVFEDQSRKQESDKFYGQYYLEQDPDVRREISGNFLRVERDFALSRAKDEITACLQDRTVEQLKQQIEQLFLSKDGSPYDYLQKTREYWETDYFGEEIARKMLSEEYGEIIKSAVASYEELVKKGKYTKEKAIALLMDRGLKDWPKTVGRILEQKKKK